MSQFNFYDVYGYLIPGAVLMSLLWAPYGLATGELPDADISSALLFVVVAYVSGHLLQIVAETAFPPIFPDDKGNRRYPSDQLLDHGDDDYLNQESKRALKRKIKSQFALDVDAGAGKDKEETRFKAFLLCRAAVIKSGAAAYPEQYQGMYALMLGLVAAFVLAASYFIGWALGGTAFLTIGWLTNRAIATCGPGVFRWLDCTLLHHLALLLLGIGGLIAVGLACGTKRLPTWQRRFEDASLRFAFCVILALVLGLYLGGIQDAPIRVSWYLLLASIGLLALRILCHARFKRFSFEFATSVYRMFLVIDNRQPRPQRLMIIRPRRKVFAGRPRWP